MPPQTVKTEPPRSWVQIIAPSAVSSVVAILIAFASSYSGVQRGQSDVLERLATVEAATAEKNGEHEKFVNKDVLAVELREFNRRLGQIEETLKDENRDLQPTNQLMQQLLQRLEGGDKGAR